MKFLAKGILLFSSVVFIRLWAAAEPVIKLVQPYENAQIPAVKKSFVFGSVDPATASLTINGVPVIPHKNGGFLTMIPFEPGRFKIEAVASDELGVSTFTRFVNVAEFPKSFPVDYDKIDPLSPKTRVVVEPGEILEVSFQGAPGGQATFKFTKGNGVFPLEEKTGILPGIYKGTYRIQRDDEFDEDNIVFSLKRQNGKKVTAKSNAKITVQKRRVPRLVELKEEAVLLTGPGSDFGYNLFMVTGTRLEVVGEWGDFLRVAVGRVNRGWVRKSATFELPPGTSLPRSVSPNIRISATDTGTLIEIPLQSRHPHRVEQYTHPHRLVVTLFGVIADTDRIRYRSNNTVVKEVLWRQEEPEACTLDILTKQPNAWGYDIRYEGTTMIIEIRHRPPMAEKPFSLKGLKVALDPGHSRQSFGTIGPLGNTEASVVLMAAKVAKQELEKAGAEVVLIQDGSKEMSLQDRVSIAWRERAHIFISIHADACPEGQDPREVEGYSIHYYHPQSHDLAEALHESYGEKTNIRDQGLWRSNLAVCRMTQMPAILMEQGFLMLPEMEDLMIAPRHHQIVAETIIEGIREFISRTDSSSRSALESSIPRKAKPSDVERPRSTRHPVAK